MCPIATFDKDSLNHDRAIRRTMTLTSKKLILKFGTDA